MMAARVNAEQFFQHSHRRGLVMLLYGLIWMIATLAGYLLIDNLFGTGNDLITALVVSAWSAALAGGLGGATAMLNRLYQHVSLEQDFLEHPLFLYLIQPVSGLIVGILSLFLLTLPVALLVNLVADPGASLADIATSSTFVALLILLAWIAGFHQEIGLKKIKTATRRFRSGIPLDAPEPSIHSGPPAIEEELSLFEAWHLQQQIRRWSFTWGIFILVYGIVCLAFLLWSALLVVRLLPQFEDSFHLAPNLVLAGWPVAVAGGMGGVLGMLRNLYHHISVERDFDRQHLMSYLVQPLLGAAFAFVLYFFLASGFLTLDTLTTEGDPSRVVDAPALIMVQLVLGWIVGFRNQVVAGLINRLINRIIALLKLIGKLIHPKNLFNRDRRNEILGGIRGQAGPFKVAGTGATSSAGQAETENLSDWFS